MLLVVEPSLILIVWLIETFKGIAVPFRWHKSSGPYNVCFKNDFGGGEAQKFLPSFSYSDFTRQYLDFVKWPELLIHNTNAILYLIRACSFESVFSPFSKVWTSLDHKHESSVRMATGNPPSGTGNPPAGTTLEGPQVRLVCSNL